MTRFGLCFVLLATLVMLAMPARADSFPVADIRLQGLQRVSAGTVFNLLPINIGDTIDELGVRSLMRTLFDSGYFHDIAVARDTNALVLTFVERPAIDSLEIDGNKAIPTEALVEGLGDQGLREGEIFKQSTLERVTLELERQYVAQGRYGSTIETEVEELPRNRVAIKINVEEGKNSGIRHINIVGAEAFSQRDLLDQLELKHPTLLSFFGGKDKYSREKLSGDMETLESWYRDRGYVEFGINSTLVSITPDRREVYLTLNVEEGEIYEVADVALVGELNELTPEQLEPLLLIREGQTFNQARVTASEERLTGALGNSGYTFASASGIPSVRDDGKVDVQFFVDAGKRAYVRRVTFAGNSVTQDHVLRREMRQMEGGWASTSQIELSKVRLERLGYFKDVGVETPEVAGTDDQIDVNFGVEEQPSGSISATLGFAEGSGLILGANYQQSNVFGTGNSFGANISWSDFQRSASVNYFNPYYTQDGISRGYNLFYRETRFDEQNIARFTTDSFGGGVNFGFPIGETQRIQFGLNVEQTNIKVGQFPALEIVEFVEREGNKFLNYKFSGSWVRSTLNRGLFATRGSKQTLSVEVAVPGSELQFYKTSLNAEKYIPLIGDSWVLRARTEVGFGDAYGSNDVLPFYEHFFAGGFGSIRGYERNTLGPDSTPTLIDDGNGTLTDPFPTSRNQNSFGGNLLLEASLELIFPLPIIEDQRQVRAVVFFDGGNVFNTNCPNISINCSGFTTDEIRYAGGVGVTWLTGLGPMTFAYSKTLNDQVGDEREGFQFELGASF